LKFEQKKKSSGFNTVLPKQINFFDTTSRRRRSNDQAQREYVPPTFKLERCPQRIIERNRGQGADKALYQVLALKLEVLSLHHARGASIE